MTTVSVILTALNEPYVVRTIQSILEASDDRLCEIIVIDDASDEPVRCDLPKTRIIRQESRIGLIRGRNLASREAVGDIIISLDSHVDTPPGWLDPIVKKVENDYKCIAVPLICGLDPVEWKRQKATEKKTGWHWNLDFYWKEDNGSDETPCFSGCCFAFSKKWWLESGGFDEGMDKWGGENIEFSLRTWLCGGSVELVRSVTIAHWFRKSFTYQMDNPTLLRNKARIAEVWFDDYKSYFYAAVSRSQGSIDFGDISDRVAIRNRLQVRSFDWFLSKFQPELVSIFKLRDVHRGARVCIVGSAPSLDDVALRTIKSFDVVIGINYASLYVQCDYVVFHDYAPAIAVLDSGKYNPSQLLVPIQLKSGNKRWNSCEISSEWTIYKLGKHENDGVLKKKDPPFFWHATSAHTAAHFAAFIGAKSVTLIGCDGKLRAGKSHTSLVKQYRGGRYWPQDNLTENFLQRIDAGYSSLKQAYKRWGIPLLRLGYV